MGLQEELRWKIITRELFTVLSVMQEEAHPEKEEITPLSIMNFEISDEQRLILDVVDEACRVRPVEDRCYLAHRFNDKVPSIFKDAHLLGLPISYEAFS